MAQLVYLLCALASTLCAILLLRNYFRSHNGLLLWSGLAFVFFALSNMVLFADFVLFPQLDLSPFRAVLTLTGTAMLLYGLIWETN